jgi:hypothetical protein
MRRAVHEAFSPSAAPRYHAIEAEEAARLVLALTSDTSTTSKPGRYAHHFSRFAASLILAITYDKPLCGAADDEMTVKTIDQIVRRVERAFVPGAHFADVWSVMLIIPARYVYAHVGMNQ